MPCLVDNVGYWTDNPIDVGDVIRASDVGGEQGVNEIKNYISAIYVNQALNWPGNASFPACGGAGFDGAAPCPVVWDLAPGDTVYQTPGAHPVSEFQEFRDKLDYLFDQLCCVAVCGTHYSLDDATHYVNHYVSYYVLDKVGHDTAALSGEHTTHLNDAKTGFDGIEDVGYENNDHFTYESGYDNNYKGFNEVVIL